MMADQSFMRYHLFDAARSFERLFCWYNHPVNAYSILPRQAMSVKQTPV